MAGKSIIGLARDDAASYSLASSVYYMPLIQSALSNSVSGATPEAANQVVLAGSGFVEKMSVNVLLNARVTTTTVRSRKNGANGNLAVSIAAGVTGLLQDLTNADTFVDGDLYCVALTNGTGSQNLTLTSITAMMTKATGNGNTYLGNLGTGASFLTMSTASQVQYTAIAGLATPGTTDSVRGTQAAIPCTGVLDRLTVQVASNARTTTTTVRSRKNSADGNMSVSIGATATGSFSDLSNTDSITSGDTCGYSFTNGLGVGNIVYRSVHTRFVGTADETPYITAGPNAAGSGVQYAGTLGRQSAVVTTEARQQLYIPYPTNVTNAGGCGLFGAGGGSLTVRNNGVDTSVVASTASSGVQTVLDSSNFAAFLPGDLLSLAWNTPAATNLNWSSYRLTDIVPRGRRVTTISGG